MKFALQIYLFFIVCLAFIPLAHAAVIYGGNVFSGDNFTTSIGGTYLIYGSDPITAYNNVTDNEELYYRNAYITSNVDDTVGLRNGTCKSTGKYTYCFKNAFIDMSKTKTFTGDYLQSVMTISIETLPLPTTVITVNRDASISAYCAEMIVVPIYVVNTGTSDASIIYTETLPENTVVLSTENGDVNGNTITFRDMIGKNMSKNYTYTMTNLDCDSKSWSAKYTITTNNNTATKTIPNVSLEMLPTYIINETLTPNKTNNPESLIEYTWSIKNVHPSLGLGVDTAITLPKVSVEELSANLINTQDIYRYSGIVPSGETMNLHIIFKAKDYGTFVLNNIGKLEIGQRTASYNSSKTLAVMHQGLNATMYINSTEDKVYVTLKVVNEDLKEKYYYIYGTFKGVGDDEPVYYNGIDPDTTIFIGNKTYNTSGMGTVDTKIVFDGIYRDKNSVDHKLYAEKTFRTNVKYADTIKEPDATPNQVIPQNTAPATNTTGIGASTNTAANNTATKPKEQAENKDIITRIIEAINNMLQSLFG